MKKLLFILSAILVSVSIGSAPLDPNTGWDYLNPYAYDLKSEVINNGQTLRLTYKFNAPGFGNSDDYNNLNPKSGGTGRGIQIYLLYKDNEGNFQRVKKDDGTEYKITSGGYNEAKTWSVDVNIIDIPDNCKGKELTWEAVVHGNIGRTKPKLVKATTTKPTNAYGIAVNNDPTHVRFAQMFVSEAYPNQRDGSKPDGWKKWGETDEYKYANTMLEYTPLLGFQCAHFKHYHNDTEKSHFASLWDWTNKYGDLTITSTYSYNYEPNRIKVSEDGRTFVSSFHPKASCVVLEYGKKRDAYNGHHFYNTIDNNWENNKDLDNISDKVDGNYNPFLYRRCVGMDVKGKGDNLKIILLWIDANAANYTISGKTVPAAKFIIYEYELGLAEAEGYIATNKYLPPFGTGCKYVHKIGEYSWDYQGWSSGGAFYQGARYGTLNNNKRYLYNNMLRGFADLAYGTNDDVWVKIDYCAETAAKPKIIRVKLNNGTTTEYTINNGSTANYGGSGILIKDGMLITSPTNSTICLYEINANGELNATDKQPNAKHTIIDNQIGSWVTGFATDYAGNLFALTQASINGENYTANILGIAMPYKKAITTRARGTFVVNDPIPNILATDLRYEPVPKQPKYRFSFNVNTTPEIAQIRFYKSYGDNGDNDMKKNLAKINADDYQGGNEITPSFVYNIPNELLKQGEIAVEFDMVGGKVENGELKNTALPRGEWYWSVYVEAPRKSTVFAPIYKQGSTGEDTHCRLHATINNYPETDQFGWIIAAQYDTRAGSAKKGLMLYGFNPTGNSDDEQSTINNSVRYKLIKEYINPTTGTNKFENQRRLAVAPDGKVFIADYGNTNNNTRPLSSVMPFKNGGIWLWDPSKQSESSNTINLSLFLNSTTETANGLAIYKDYNDETKIKLYGTNTYGEFEYHGKYYEEAAQEVNGIFGKNGIKEYELGKPENIYQKETQNTITRQLGAGDGNGNISIVTMDKGIWIAQHRLNDVQYALDQFRSGKEENLALPDNPFNYILSFVPYKSSTRTWASCSSNGVSFSASNRTYEFKADASDLTQKTTSPLQSCPGAGLAYRKITAGSQKGEYLYIVNHEGNIVELQITSWNGNKPTVVYKKTLPSAGNKIDIPGTTRKTGAISTINFDYAGNLITTSGTEYLGDASQDIIVYTMPYDRVNAREIQAPNSCRFIPERTAYLEPRSEMELTLQPYVANTTPCYLDIFRPMPNTSFSTICLPFDLDMKQLTTEALKDAEVKQYTGLQLSDIGGEKMLELVFEDVPIDGEGKQVLIANTPYIIQPKVRIPGIIKLQNPIQFVAINEQSVVKETQDKEYAITFKGLIPTEEQIKVNQPLTLLLVAENRLAEMVPDAGTTGRIFGFRGYFELNKPLNGIAARITPKQSVSTSTTIIVDGKRVNIEKYLREGRVYIRMGDSLYTIDGQKVK